MKYIKIHTGHLQINIYIDYKQNVINKITIKYT